MAILITGAAGFIGSNLAEYLINDNDIIGIDNFDPFYDINIKKNNLDNLLKSEKFTFVNMDFTDEKQVDELFSKYSIHCIIHLGGKAGVRPSILAPQDYVKANIQGTVNLLEAAKKYDINNFVFASSSSVYGNLLKGPFSETLDVRECISPYASTKLSCEHLCYTYSHLYNIKVKALRFFTVYGRRQRPDLAIHKFTDKISNGDPIEIYGDGYTGRDYTYIDDILYGIKQAMLYNDSAFEVFNLGGSSPVLLKDLVQTIEEGLDIEAKKVYLPKQPGDVELTFADISKAQSMLNYTPTTNIQEGINKFIQWYKVK